jgi:hypothetical protein
MTSAAVFEPVAPPCEGRRNQADDITKTRASFSRRQDGSGLNMPGRPFSFSHAYETGPNRMCKWNRTNRSKSWVQAAYGQND